MNKATSLLLSLAGFANGGPQTSNLPSHYLPGERYQYAPDTPAKAWVNAQQKKVRAGATSPSVDTRQRRRATERAAAFAPLRMTWRAAGRDPKTKRTLYELKNGVGIKAPRRSRRSTLKLTVNV